MNIAVVYRPPGAVSSGFIGKLSELITEFLAMGAYLCDHIGLVLALKF